MEKKEEEKTSRRSLLLFQSSVVFKDEKCFGSFSPSAVCCLNMSKKTLQLSCQAVCAHTEYFLWSQELSKRISRTDDRLGVGSVELYDVRAIHTLLMQELNSVQAASAAGRHQLILEVRSVVAALCSRCMQWISWSDLHNTLLIFVEPGGSHSICAVCFANLLVFIVHVAFMLSRLH